MDWVLKDKSFQYLKELSKNIDPSNENEVCFKYALDWALSTLELQAKALYEIETSCMDECQNSDVKRSYPPPPKLTLIQGGKN